MQHSDPSALFWYRRSLTTLVILACSVAAIALTDGLLHDAGFQLAHAIAISVAAGVIVGSVTGFFLKHAPAVQYLSFALYILLLLVTSYGVLFAAATTSLQYAAIWMLCAVAGGMWGVTGSLTALVCGVGVVAYILNTSGGKSYDSILYIVAFCLSSVIGFLAFRRQTTPNTSAAYTELAHELSQVSSESDIVINSIGDGVIALDGAGIIKLINPAAQRIMGWGAEDALDLDYRSIFKITDAKDAQFVEDAGPIQQVLRGNQTLTRNDIKLQTSSGKKINISLLVSPVGQQGNGAIIVFRDITSDVSENQQRAEFISTASHEMRTPVAAIEGYLGLALNQNTATVDERAREYITKAHESAEHLGHLFQDLLDVSKAEDGRLNSNPVAIEIVSFLRETVGILTKKATDKGLKLVFVPDAQGQEGTAITPLYYTEADKDHLREVASNLIENAVKYTKEGTVTVDITGTEDKVIISIKDTGIGIAREDIPHLFQKFYRIDSSDTREIGGTGLGLYLCRRLVESMNGRIWVESEQGKGSMFFVELNRLTVTTAETPDTTPAVTIEPIKR